MKIIGNTVGMGLPKPNLMQADPKKGSYVKGKEEFLEKNVSEAINAALAQEKNKGSFVPTGGTAGQVLTMGANGAYWADPPAGGGGGSSIPSAEGVEF